MPDGRFILIEPIEEKAPEDPAPVHLRVTMNWYEEFRDRDQDLSADNC